MKERLYLASDRRLEEKAQEIMTDEALFASLRSQAMGEKKRVTSKAKILLADVKARHKKFLADVPIGQQEQMTSTLSDLEKKRERSKSGLVGALVRQGVIQKEHVNSEDGSLDVAALSQTSYFKENAHLLDVLSTYQLSKKSKVRQEAGKIVQDAVPEEVPEKSVVQPVAVMHQPEQSAELLSQPDIEEKSVVRVEDYVKPSRRRRGFMRVTAAAATTLAILGGGVKATSVSEVSAEENAPYVAASTSDMDTDGWDEGEKRPHYKPKKGEFHVLDKEKDQSSGRQESDKKKDREEKKHKPGGELREAREAIRSQKYTVKSGDTLWHLAKKNYGDGDKWPKIAQANCRTLENPNMILVGQSLRVPEKKKGRYALTYVVKPGDTLFDIARRKCSKVDAIVAANPEIKDKDLIYPKQVFDVPVKKQQEPVGGVSSYQAKEQGKAHKRDGQNDSSAPRLERSSNPAGGFVDPLSSCEVTSGYGMRFHPIYKEYRVHTGLDMGAPEGTRVGSIGAGRVEFAGWTNGYGNTIIVDHPGPIDSMYGHLSGIDTYAGESVSAGEQIGRVGTTGISTGPHLHLEIQVNGEHKNPQKWLPDPC